jgi:CheY-like chemotaxis protein
MCKVTARALVQRADVCAGPYSVIALSDSAVVLAGEIPFGIGERCRIALEIPGQPLQRMDAECVTEQRCAGRPQVEMAFRDMPTNVQASLRSFLQSMASGKDEPAAFRENRRFPRVRIAATASVLVGQRYVGTYVARDLSAGGAHLVGDNNLTLGQPIQVLIRVNGYFSRCLKAEVIRREQLASGEQSFAVAFRDMEIDTEDALQQLALLFLEQTTAGKTPTIMVLATPSPVLVTLEEDLQSLGHEMVNVVAPLDALSWLSSEAGRVSVAIVGCDATHMDGIEFLNFLKDSHPPVRRVALPHDSQHPQLKRAIASGVVEAVLDQPWDRHTLSRVLLPVGV